MMNVVLLASLKHVGITTKQDNSSASVSVTRPELNRKHQLASYQTQNNKHYDYSQSNIYSIVLMVQTFYV